MGEGAQTSKLLGLILFQIYIYIYIYIYAAIALTLPSSGSYKTYYNLENF
jgi:hypothetical protein